ncbi:hypothetical protein J6590_025403 [Homalodisca vitripennis]|nr:hypothetical protein J6590_025403 [Homalodisca vitripennis]
MTQTSPILANNAREDFNLSCPFGLHILSVGHTTCAISFQCKGHHGPPGWGDHTPQPLRSSSVLVRQVAADNVSLCVLGVPLFALLITTPTATGPAQPSPDRPFILCQNAQNAYNQMDTRPLRPARPSPGRYGIFVKSKYTQSNRHPTTATGPPNPGRYGIFVKSKYTQSNRHPTTATGPPNPARPAFYTLSKCIRSNGHPPTATGPARPFCEVEIHAIK